MIAGYGPSPILVTIGSINEQGNALRLHFEAVAMAAVELPVASGEGQVEEQDQYVFEEPALPGRR
jgi:hypothetical protein